MNTSSIPASLRPVADESDLPILVLALIVDSRCAFFVAEDTLLAHRGLKTLVGLDGLLANG